MNGIIVAVVLYQVIVITGVVYWIKKTQTQDGESFLLSNRDLPVPVVGVTIGLTVLGAAHVFGLMENAYEMGAVSLWFSFAHVILITVICLVTGRWVRRLKVGTVPEMVQLLYDRKVRTITACTMAGVIFGLLTMEAQALGVSFAAITGWSLPVCIIIGGILGILYVYLAGMKEIGWVNLINAVVMYLGLIVAIIYLTGVLPGGSWESVNNYFIDKDQAHMLSIFGTKDLMVTFALSSVLSVVLAQSVSQMALQTAMSAKNEETVKKSLWIAAPVNGLFGVLIVAVGLAAVTIPQFNALGAKLAGPVMLVTLLPNWLVIWLWAGFNGAILSTFAMNSLTPATLFVKDIYVSLYDKEATDEEQTKYVRATLVVVSILAIIVAMNLPPMVTGLMWLFAWLVPVFWILVTGMFWKRNATAAFSLCIITWLVNMLWTFTPLPTLLHLESLHNVYITLGVTVVLGVIFNLTMKGKPGFFKENPEISTEAISA